MASAPIDRSHQAEHVAAPVTVSVQCECAGESVDMALTVLRSDGCEVEATSPWHGDCDFVRLLIDERIAINGRVLWRRGNHAGIGFFGQIHPVVVSQLAG